MTAFRLAEGGWERSPSGRDGRLSDDVFAWSARPRLRTLRFPVWPELRPQSWGNIYVVDKPGKLGGLLRPLKAKSRFEFPKSKHKEKGKTTDIA